MASPWSSKDLEDDKVSEAWQLRVEGNAHRVEVGSAISVHTRRTGTNQLQINWRLW